MGWFRVEISGSCKLQVPELRCVPRVSKLRSRFGSAVMWLRGLVRFYRE